MKRKSRFLTFILSCMPGLGHLYLGLKIMGLELMASFLLCIYLADYLRLGILTILIPLIWFYSMFDAMQKLEQEEPLKDRDIFNFNAISSEHLNLNKRNKVVGIVLIALGVIVLFNRILMPIMDEFFDPIYRQYIETTIVAIVLILGGIKLILGQKINDEKQGDIK